MKKYTIGVLVIVVLGVAWAVFMFGSDDAVKSQVESAITVTEPSYDFGDVDIFGGKIQTTYTLKNTGQEDIYIVSALTSCMCTEGEIGGLTFGMHESKGDQVIIPRGEEEILSATFDPLAHGPNGVGKIKRELILRTNSSLTPEIKVYLTANVVKNESE